MNTSASTEKISLEEVPKENQVANPGSHENGCKNGMCSFQPATTQPTTKVIIISGLYQ